MNQLEHFRDLPLPEVKQEPMFWFSENKRDIVSHSHRQAYGNTKNVASEYSIPLYTALVDFEALRKENEQLRRLLGEFDEIMTASCDWPDTLGEQTGLQKLVLKVRKIIGVI